MEDQIKFLIDTYGIDDQRTTAWFQKRGEMLTASEIWKCFGTSTPAARTELILSKLVAPKNNQGGGVGALIWGTRFEPIAKEIYCFLEKVEIKDLSCVVHPEHSYIGASPDGLILCSDERNGRLIELKCPISRSFDDTTPIPEHYFHQMQLQMECTNLKECDYVEMQFKSMNYSEWFETESEFKSCFAVNSAGIVKYKFISDTRTIQEWTVDTFGEDFMDWQIVYWTLKMWRKKLVLRDPDWMPSHFLEMKQTWDEILEHRKNGTLPSQVKTTILEL